MYRKRPQLGNQRKAFEAVTLAANIKSGELHGIQGQAQQQLQRQAGPAQRLVAAPSLPLCFTKHPPLPPTRPGPESSPAHLPHPQALAQALAEC